MRLLDREFLELQTIDLNNLSNKFNTERWDYKKGSLAKWMTNKWSHLLRLSEEYPSDTSRNIAMCRVLTELVPPHFNDITNRYRVDRPDSWRTLESALKDFETASPMEKSENQGKSFHTRLEKVEKRLNQDGGDDAYVNFAGGRKGKKGFGKKGYGKQQKGNYGGPYGGNYGGNFYDRRFRGKKGDKGFQKKGGTGFQGQCFNCDGFGHSAKYCSSDKDPEKKKKGE